MAAGDDGRPIDAPAARPGAPHLAGSSSSTVPPRFEVARATAFTVTLLAATFAAGGVETGVLASIGALNVFLAEAPGTTSEKTRRAALTAIACGGGIAVGTWVAPLGLVALGAIAGLYFALQLANRWPRYGSVVLVTGVLIAIGVGLPGGGAASVGYRGAVVLAGGAWAVLGIAATGVLLDVGRNGRRSSPPMASAETMEVAVRPWSQVVPLAAAVAGAAAAGLAISEGLGLQRDYWLLLTLLVVLHAELRDTYRFAVLRLGGTVVGAAAAAGVVLGTSNPWIDAVVLTGACAAAFALRRGNYAAYTAFLTVYVIVLLNEAYPAGLRLAETRVLDTAIGGALALAAGAVLALARRSALGARSVPRER